MESPTARGLRPGLVIAEDDARQRTLLAELLEAEDLAVVGLAADGLEAVELARELNPDVVLMDLRMPGLSGFEATRLIKEDLPLTQVIILTAYDGPLPERSAEDAGAYTYLVKGCSTAFIKEMIVQAWHFKAGMERRAQHI